MKMFRTSRLQKIVKVAELQVIDEVAKVPRSMRRRVPMIQEMQKDQKPEEVQIRNKMYVDHAKDGQNDTAELKNVCTTLSPYLKGRTDKAEVQKDENVSPRDAQS